MGEQKIKRFKRAVKKEFNRRKRTEEGLKQKHVYHDMSKRAGYRNWNPYCAILMAAED